MSQTEDTPRVAIVVIGRNEGERLVRCLKSIRALAYPADAIEVVYVDSDSSDGSPERAHELGARVVRVRPARPSAALGRNAGWRATTAPFVMFLDGDTVLHPQFLATALPQFEDRSCAVVWGHRREIHPRHSIYNRVLDLDWVYPPGPAEFCGGDALMRRSVLERVGGFDASLIAGEEPELCRRIRATGSSILHIDHPMTGHDLAIHHIGQYWKRAVRAGFAYAEVSERFRDSDMPLWDREVKRNLVHASVLVTVPVAGAIASIALRSSVPIAGALALLAALVVRTALKAAWKDRSLVTRLLYGVHSHFQQLPIAWGQLRYARSKRRGERQALIEYKETSA